MKSKNSSAQTSKKTINAKIAKSTTRKIVKYLLSVLSRTVSIE